MSDLATLSKEMSELRANQQWLKQSVEDLQTHGLPERVRVVEIRVEGIQASMQAVSTKVDTIITQNQATRDELKDTKNDIKRFMSWLVGVSGALMFLITSGDKVAKFLARMSVS